MFLEEPGGDYNALPYVSTPFAHTAPARLAAVAALFGLEAPAAERARVLELGCASGGNIVPLAACFPAARFVGIDLAARHVEEGRRRIAALRLQNIELRQGDLARVDLAGERFDYVVCHGVFSWVPRDAQDGILRICRDSLVENGVATVSYNVLPGWHLRSVVRDICLQHAGTEGAPRQRVDSVRCALDAIARSASGTDPYGMLLRNEAKRLARRPASYVLGEFLAPHNAPCYFHDFAARAEQSGLGYLCEADLAASVDEILAPETQQRIRALAGSRRFGFEQYVDFFTGRPFRRSVLIRSAQAAAVRRSRSVERLRRLHFAADLRLDTSVAGAAPVFRDPRGRAAPAQHPAVRRALTRLAHAYPSTLQLAQLVEPAPQGEAGMVEQRVGNALFSMLASGQATACTVPLKAGRGDAPRPAVWRVARAEAAAGQRWVTSLAHTPVPLRPVHAALVQQLDGTTERTPGDGPALDYLARNALLEPDAAT